MASGGVKIEVIGGARANVGRDGRSAAGGELVGVQTRLQARALARHQDRPRLVRREHARFAEDVAPLREAARRYCGNHLLDDQLDVVAAPRAVLRRDLVGAQKRRHQIDRVVAIERAHGAQHFQLALGVEPVSALRLRRRRAAREHFVEAHARLAGEIRLACLPRRSHRREDATAGAGDLRVGRPAQPAMEFVPPVPRKDDVGVRIDKARNERAAGAINLDDIWPVGRSEDRPLHPSLAPT